MTKTGAAARPSLENDSESLMEFVQRYQRPLTIGAIVLALGIGGWWMASRSAAIRETRAAEALQVGETAYLSASIALAQTEFEKVMTRYPGTTAGAQAALLTAQIFYEAGKQEDGIAVLRTASAKAPRHMRAGILALLGVGEAMAGRPAAAATAYEGAAAAAQFRQEREQYQMDAARQWVAAADFAAARAIYQAIADREDSGYSSEARLRLGELLGKA